MSTLDQVRHGLHHALESLAEGWHALRQRAAHAMTHFSLREDEEVPAMSRWALLAAEVREDDARILVELEVPGMRAEDFDVEIIDDLLVIRGEKRWETEDAGKGRYYLAERAYGAFERALHLPAEVDQARTQARYRRGVLSIVLPKRNLQRSSSVTVGLS